LYFGLLRSLTAVNKRLAALEGSTGGGGARPSSLQRLQPATALAVVGVS
jgi:hypothetical protein